TLPGSLIDLTSYPDFDSYLTQTFSNKRRSYFKKCENMLHACFDISHKVYYGAMEKEVYESIFRAFQRMQSDRFKQLGIKDDSMGMWPIYEKNTLQLVLEKKACISVIYDGSKPIAISLNYLLGKAVFGFTKTFDMAYAKFGLGNFMLLKMIAWSHQEGFEVLDFMKGEYSYKNRFTDNSYAFLIQVAYSKKNLKQRVWGLTLTLGLRVFYSLYHVYRFLGLHGLLRQKTYTREKESPVKSQELSKNESSILPTETKTHLDAIKNKDFKKAVCDFCFMNKEPLKSIELYTTEVGEEYLKLISPSKAVLLTNSTSKTRR
ncbi:MAG: GNAT family N-acetyltransferase, partial [Muricauda sp.]|nr:GNAT family N-acetyltransferase [Allomuricauda sp.]